MIANVTKGKSFAALTRYLEAGRDGGDNTHRVAWTEARNIPTNDPQTAADLMQTSATQSARTQKPVYHIALSFDPEDAVDRATMLRVADRLRSDLGIQEHQALIMAHNDTRHAHLHMVINRGIRRGFGPGIRSTTTRGSSGPSGCKSGSWAGVARAIARNSGVDPGRRLRTLPTPRIDPARLFELRMHAVDVLPRLPLGLPSETDDPVPREATVALVALRAVKRRPASSARISSPRGRARASGR